MITREQYFGNKPRMLMHEEGACWLLQCVNALLADFRLYTGYFIHTDPDTGTEISGTRGGSGDGGFRGPDSLTGAPGGAHRDARAVDVFDLDDQLDRWLTTFDNGPRNDMLEKHHLYREDPSATPTWCHLQTRPPLSKRRTFIP